ncbi:MAG: thioredoxin family protein [Gammaproteobacteria bacterium]|nr:thioredoxin family protein [Gammaproteobacteria bacterium]
MKLQLILTDNCTTCARTISTWRELSEQYGLEFEVVEHGTKKGLKLAEEHDLKVFPVLLVDNKVIAVGSPDKERAMAIINNLKAVAP